MGYHKVLCVANIITNPFLDMPWSVDLKNQLLEKIIRFLIIYRMVVVKQQDISIVKVLVDIGENPLLKELLIWLPV
jgi:hypothetical protein